MPKFKKQTTSFIGGEQTPLLDARVDLQKYNSSAKVMKNVLIEPTGAVKRRYGTEDLQDIGLFDPELIKMDSFELTSGKNFLILFRLNNLRVIDTETNTMSAQIPTPYDLPKEIDVAQSLNTMVITHPDHPPMKLSTTDGTVNGFVLETIRFVSTPQYDFGDDDSPISQQDVTRFNAFLDSGTTIPDNFVRFKLSVNGNVTRDINGKNEPDTDYTGINNKIRIVFNNNVSTQGQDFTIKIKCSYSGYEFKLNTKIDGNPLSFETNPTSMTAELRDAISRMIDVEMWNGVAVLGSSGDTTNITSFPVTVTHVSGTAGNDFTFDVEFGTGFADFSIPVSAEGRFHLEGDVRTTDILQTGRLGYSRYLDILTALHDLNIWKDKYNVKLEIHNETDHTPDVDTSRADVGYTPVSSSGWNQIQQILNINNQPVFPAGSTKAPASKVIIDPEFTIKIIGDDANAYEMDALVTNDAIDFVDGTGDPAEPAFFKINKIASGKSREEDVWSKLRGYPARVAFIESRLVFGGGNSLPNFLWMSRTSDFFNFDDGDGNPDDAIVNIAPTTNKLNKIEYIIGKNSLQLFTVGSEHYNPKAITPAEFSLPLQSNEGCLSGVKPVIVDNSTFFLDKNGNSLRQFIYDDLELSYKANNVSLLADHLIDDIQDMTAMKDESNNFIFLLRGDGGLTVVNSIREQNIINFVNWDLKEISPFAGQQEITIEAIQAVNGQLYAAIRHPELGGKIIRFDKNRALDFSKVYEPVSGDITIPSADLNDFHPFTISVVDSFNTIHLHKAFTGDDINPPDLSQIVISTNTGDAEAGIYFAPEIETKDVAIDFGEGEEFASIKKISEIWVSTIDGAGWEIEYEGEVYDIDDETDIINEPIARKNGDTRIRLLGYTNRGNIILRQNLSLKNSYVISLIKNIKVR